MLTEQVWETLAQVWETLALAVRAVETGIV
jgi:hypothetical protein